MARSMSPNSAGSQFFIMHENSSHLDGQYAGFGNVISGMEFVDNIVKVKTGSNDRPVDEQRIKTMTVELNGYEFEEPSKI